MQEQIRIKLPNELSGLYGIEIHCRDRAKIEHFYGRCMVSFPSTMGIYWQGGSHDYPDTDWILFEFWCSMTKGQQDILVYIAEALCLELNLPLDIR